MKRILKRVLIVFLLIVLVGALPSCSCFKEKSEFERNYIDNKDFLEEKNYIVFGNNFEYVFVNKNQLSKSEYIEWKYSFGADFEEAVVSYHFSKYYLLIFKGDADRFKKRMEKDEAESYYFFDDYAVFDDNWVLRFFDWQDHDGFLITQKGNVLLNYMKYHIENDSLTLPKNVKMVSFFYNVEPVKEITCNEELIRIGRCSFMDCYSLENIRLNKGFKEIGAYAFYGCVNLKQIVIPKSVEIICEEVFNETIVYCEAESKPDGWNENFAVENAKVYYANEWHYDKDGNPVVNSTPQPQPQPTI